MASTPAPAGDGQGWGAPSAQERAIAEVLFVEQLAELNAGVAHGLEARDEGVCWDDDLDGGRGAPDTDARPGARTPVAGMLDLLDSLGSEPGDLALLAGLDLAAMGPLELMEHLAALDRVNALVAWLRARGLVAAAGAQSSGSLLAEVHLEHEIAIARRTSRYSAGRALEDARALATTFPGFAAALRAGEVSERHVAVLVEKTRPIQHAEVLAAIEARVLGHAKAMPVTRFGTQLARAIAELDPDAEGRARRARTQRGVQARALDDGLGLLTVVDDWPTICALAQTLDTDAAALRTQRGGAAAVGHGNQDARLGACRADALAARVLGTIGPDGAVTHDRTTVPVTLNLVMDLQTMRGERDRLALLQGQPVPAGIGRDWLTAVKTWRRCLTDPVTGVLLDYGTTQYLPAPLRRYIMARDHECRSPICSTTSPARLQLDHADEFPTGPSSAANTGLACTTEHQLKTAGLIDITHSAPDGSCTWTTTWGQSVHIPARPYLHDPTQPDPPLRQPDTPPHDSPPTAAGNAGGSRHPDPPPF